MFRAVEPHRPAFHGLLDLLTTRFVNPDRGAPVVT
jgi:hypothetical protein